MRKLSYFPYFPDTSQIECAAKAFAANKLRDHVDAYSHYFDVTVIIKPHELVSWLVEFNELYVKDLESRLVVLMKAFDDYVATSLKPTIIKTDSTNLEGK